MSREKTVKASLDWIPERISARTRNQTRDALVESEGRYAALICIPKGLIQVPELLNIHEYCIMQVSLMKNIYQRALIYFTD